MTSIQEIWDNSRIEHIIGLTRDYVNPGLAKLMQFGGFGDVEISAEGCVLTTASGETYLDFVGGFGVFSVGHRHPEVVAAAHRQLDRLPLSTRTFFNEPQALLAAKLAEIAPSPLSMSFFSNSGTEAVEAGLKFARAASGKTDFISTDGAYHGKTLGSLSVTGRDSYRTPFQPLLPGCVQVPYDDLGAVESAITTRTAAIIVEAIQGEGGIIVPSEGYLKGLRSLCDRHSALLIVDEVQTGLGRTGTLFAVEREGVVPDIMTLAKAIGGGVMPLGVTMTTREVAARVFGENPLLHTSTFGGNPLACAVGLATIQVILQENLCQRATMQGARLLSGLQQVQKQLPDALTDVRGRGLMIGVEFAVKDVAELTINGMARRGIIAAYTLNNPKVIRFEPPLTVSDEQIDKAVTVFAEAVGEAVEFLQGLDPD